MAKGKATPASFKKGDPRASAAGKKSSRALPPDVKEARQFNANEFTRVISQYMNSTAEELKAKMSDPATPARDLVVIKMLVLAIQHGDIARLNLLLDRTIGKVPDKIQAEVGTYSLHDMIVEKLENGG